MTPVITDLDTGRILWRGVDCAAHVGIQPNTWRTYVSTGRAPQPVTNLGDRMPLWDADEVRQWHTGRPGSPVKGAPKKVHS